MKRNLTFVLSVLALMACLIAPKGMNGQTYSLTPDQASTGSNATSYITTLTEFTYNSVSWKMNQWNPSSLQIKTNQSSAASEWRFYNTSAIPGTITQVVIKFSALTLSNTSNTGFMFVGGTSEVTATTGGTAGTWNSVAKTITWTPSSTDNFTYFALYQNGKVATGTNKLATSDAIVVTYTTGGTAPTTYTVTYNANVTGVSPIVDTYNEGDDVTLREANTFTNEGYTFDEWNTEASGDGDSYAAGDVIEDIQEDIELYAIWTENAPSNDHWVLTELANLTSDDVFVIVGNNGSNYAMSNNGGTTDAPSAVAVTVTGNEITSNVAATIQWTISGNADGYTFYPNGSTSTWLYCTATNNGVRVGTNANKTFVIDATSGYLKHNGTSRYVGIYNSADWRCYTSAGGNIANQTFAFYKKVTGEVIPPSITAGNVDITYDATSGNVAYTINNEPTPAGTLTAAVAEGATIVDLSLGTPSNGTIAFTCAANTVTTARTATVTLTYAYGDDEPVTKDVTITQAAAPLIYTTIPDLFAAATTTETNVLVTFNNWVVSGVSTNGKNVFVTDNNGNGFVIYYNSDMSSTFAAGNTLSGTAVSCTLKKYNGFAELLNVTATDLTITSGGTVTVADIAMANLVGVNTGALLHYDNLTCVLTTNQAGTTTYYNLTDGTTTLQVYSAIYNFGTLEEGKTYNITGVYQQFNNTKEILPRSAEDIEEVEVQHEEYTLTVGNLSHVNLFVFGGEESETIISTEDGETTAQVYDGTEVLVSIDVEAGYVFQSLTITDGNGDAVETEVLTPNEYYSFVMPASNVTISATAVEYVAPTDDQYELYNGDLMEGDYIIYYNGYALKNEALGTSGRLAYEVVTLNNDVIYTSDASIVWHIAPSATEDYWTIYSDDANAYAASTGAKNKAQMLADGTNDKALWSVTDTESKDNTYEFVNKYNYDNNVNHLLRNNGTNGFACYAAATGGALSLYKKVEAPVTETYTLDIAGYTDVTEGTNNQGYYLIASPVTVDPANVQGMTDGDFDLFYFDQAQEGAEWRNYEANVFDLEPTKGYLYAKKATTEGEVFNFTLTGTPYNSDGIVELEYSEGTTFAGWNLVGNPFGETATIDKDFYRLNGTSYTHLMVSDEATVDAMEGVFVVAEGEGETVTFTEAGTALGPDLEDFKKIVLNVVRNRAGIIDRAIVRFGEGRQLPKFQLNPNDTKIYITEGNQDYAVVYSDNNAEIPVSFKAAERGTYTINADVKNVDMNYLHIIDNMTGMDVDLLATPSYTFEATPADYATRFRLMFSANTVSENATTFAYFNGSEWVVNNPSTGSGSATLQVVDVMGRILRNEQVNGNVTLNLNETPGVYMLRLVNGDNVMIQKIVVR